MLRLKNSLDEILNAINDPSISQEVIKNKQQEFTDSVKQAWEKYQEGKIKTEIESMTKIMYLFAVNDLPQFINDLEKNREVINKNLKLFKTTMEVLLKPVEIDNPETTKNHNSPEKKIERH